MKLWMLEASSWNVVEVVRPQPGQAATSGTKVRKPDGLQQFLRDLHFQRAVAVRLRRERNADGVADALLQQHAHGGR